MILDPTASDIVAISAAAVAVVGVVLAAAAHRRVAQLRDQVRILQGDGEPTDLAGSVHRQMVAAQELTTEVIGLQELTRRLQDDVSDALRHVAVVRYDAFGDQGGRLSFSAALLDDSGDGILLSAIHGRAESRTYAKGIKAGRSVQQLSPEEEQAVGHARRRAGVEPAQGGADQDGTDAVLDEGPAPMAATHRRRRSAGASR